MAFSAGTFSLYTPGNPVVTGTTIQSSWANNTLLDIATGLSTAVLKDGTQTITANIPLSGFKLTGLGAATTNGDALRYEQLFSTSAVSLLGPLADTVATGLSAAGTSQTDATEVTSTINGFTTAASGTGARLPPTPTAGQKVVIYNGGANAMKVYPQASGTINGLSANTGHVLAVKTACSYWALSTTAWVAILSA